MGANVSVEDDQKEFAVRPAHGFGSFFTCSLPVN